MTSHPDHSTTLRSADGVIAEFAAAMAAAGVPHDGDIIPDGKIHRYHMDRNRKSRRDGWYLCHSDGTPAGAFGSWKTGEKFKWVATGVTPLTDEERRIQRAKVVADRARRVSEQAATFAAAALKANEIWDAARPCDEHPYLARKGVTCSGLRTAVWVKDHGHDPVTSEVKETRIPGALLVKVRNAANQIVSLQAIFADANNPLGRDKDFLTGGEKRGCWFSIGKPVDLGGRKTVVVCEGLATGASVYMATGIGVVVAFDAGNLQPVCEALRRLWPDMQIIVAADNDRWTLKPVVNPGLAYARQAAAHVHGLVAMPEFADVQSKPTDFNDLHALDGLPVVADQIMAALVEPVVMLRQLPWVEPDPVPAPTAAAEDKKAERARKKGERIAATAVRATQYAEAPDAHDPDVFFTVLGHDRTKIFVFSHEMKLVVAHPINQWRNSLLEVARAHWWEREFSNNKVAAENWLIAMAYRKGFYDPAMSRGRGAWIDQGRIVYHFGNMLLVDGVETPVTAIESKYVYEQGKLLPPPSGTRLTDAEGRAIFDLAKKFRWAKPGSAILLAGFVALAAVCGALKWRPHIWITGSQGSGKTTILDDFVSVLMAGTALFSQGNSTEAGIRQKLQSDALPVLFDESEQNDEKAEARVQSVLALARQASSESGAKTYKGTASGEGTDFLIRSMFCLSSIQVNIKNDADRARLTVLGLRSSHDGEVDVGWPALKEALYMLARDADLPARLMRRSLDLLPVTFQNIDVFVVAAAKRFGSQREGDQYGTLMAGAWSLVNSGVATAEQADAMIARYDWSEYVEHTESDESTNALSALLAVQIRMPIGGNLSVHELICSAADDATDFAQRKTAYDTLRRHGVVIDHGDAEFIGTHLFVAYSAADRMRDSMPIATRLGFKGHMKRLKEGRKPKDPIWMPGGNGRGVMIPMTMILRSEATASAELAYEPGCDDPPF